MAASEDTEITLGTGKMLALFFGLVALCAVFFGMGFSLGKNSGKPNVELQAERARPRASHGSQSCRSSRRHPISRFTRQWNRKIRNADLTAKTADAPASTQPSRLGRS